MARHSITAAAKLAGIARSAMYEHYINNGKLSVSHDERNKPYIDTSELLRVFGQLPGMTTEVQDDKDGQSRTVEGGDSGQSSVALAVATAQLTMLEQQLRDKDAEIERYRERETRLLALLEYKPAQTEKKKRWWQF
jgi:hypothetical protein